MPFPPPKYRIATKKPDLSHKRDIGRALLLVFVTLIIIGLVIFLALNAFVAEG